MREEEEEYHEKNLDIVAHTLRAYDRQEAYIPQGYSSVVVTLDARPSASLNWNSAVEAAEKYIHNGLHIVFELDFGLNQTHFLPFTHHARFSSLALAVTQFMETLFTKMQEHIAGVIFFRGSLDVSRYISWDATLSGNFYDWLVAKELNLLLPTKESFCEGDVEQFPEGKKWQLLFLRDAFVEYMELLAAPLYEKTPCLILFDAQAFRSPLLFAQMSNRSRYDHFFLAIKNAPIPLGQLVWEEGSDTEGYIGTSVNNYHQIHPSCGIVIPSYTLLKSSAYKGLEEVMQSHTSCKVIAEDFLTTSWEGLDELIVCRDGISQNGLRKLEGFTAAGGVVRYV